MGFPNCVGSSWHFQCILDCLWSGNHRQNHQNRNHVESSSKYPGVSWFERDQKWRARITVNRKGKHLGYFDTEIEAFNAYKQAVETIGEEILQTGFNS